MTFEEKVLQAKSIYENQKEVYSKINLSNYFNSIQTIRKLELQKEIIKAIPTTKPTN